MAIDFKAQMAAKRAAAMAHLEEAVDKVVQESPTGTEPQLEKALQQVQAVEQVQAMSFKEKMALKKKLEEHGKATDVVAKDVPNVPNVVAPPPSPSIKPEGSSGAVPPITVDSASTVAKVDTGADSDRSAVMVEGAPEQQQAYADISSKIELLESLQDTALEGAMKELKRALMANPNAVALMHDTDYGKMVIALRKLTREAQVEAAAEKKTGGTKKKNTPLSAEAMAAVWEEI